MIKIKKPKNEHDNYCTCCGKPFEDSMQILFSHKGYNFSSIITLCGKCRAELMEELGKANKNSALDHIYNVVTENSFNKGYDAGYTEGLERGKADAAFSASNLVKRLMANFDDVLSIGDVLEELNILEKTAEGE